MQHVPCRLCRYARLILLAGLLGAASGFGANAAGWNASWSMSATFFGAIIPLLWFARRNRRRNDESP